MLIALHLGGQYLTNLAHVFGKLNPWSSDPMHRGRASWLQKCVLEALLFGGSETEPEGDWHSAAPNSLSSYSLAT